MVKKFTTNCNFGGRVSPVTLFIGSPSKGNHPLSFQNKWLSQEKGGNIPQNIMDSFSKLSEIAEKNKVSFEDLCSYVIDEINSNQAIAKEAKNAYSLKEGENNKEEKTNNEK